jgi:HEAT repeat protein
MAAYGAVMAIAFAILETRWDSAFEATTRRLELIAEEIGEKFWLSPMLFPILATMRSLPFRFCRFSHYAIDSLLLKRSGPDIEFMHRLLRDYFALRDLQPSLRSNEALHRLQAVRTLGYQGDAAVGALAEFVRDKDVDTRVAAAWAFGRISSPEITQHIEVALTDEAEQVRATAVSSTKGMIETDRFHLLSSIVEDESLLVQRAHIELLLQDRSFYSWAHALDPSDISDSHMAKVMRNVERRDDLRSIVFEFISDGSNYSLGENAILLAVRFKDLRAVPAITEVLQSGKRLRFAAAEALGEIGDPQAMENLKQAADDRNQSVRFAAQLALTKLGIATFENERRGFLSRFFWYVSKVL